MDRLPIDLLQTILAFCDIQTILNCRLISRSFYQYMRSPFLWKQLTFYLLTRTRLKVDKRATNPNEIYSERVFFELLRILSTRDDLTNWIRENSCLQRLGIDWPELAMILRRSPLITCSRRSSIFNLEGSVELKQSYVRLVPVVGLNCIDFVGEFVVAKMSPHALLGLLKCLADWYWENNAQLHDEFFESDIFLTLFYAMIGLEADFCRCISLNVMTKREFIKACQYSYERTILKDEFLGTIYDFVLLQGLNLGFPNEKRAHRGSIHSRNGKFFCYTIKNASCHSPEHSPESIVGELEMLRV